MNFFLKLDTGYLFFFTAKKFYKIPINLNAYQNLLIEKKKIYKVKKDKIFKNFLNKEIFFILKVSNRCKIFNINKNKNFLYEYENLFRFKRRSKKNKIIKTSFFKDIKLLLNNEYFLYKKIFKKFSDTSINFTSCHGDFYYKNILENNNKKLLIDWNNFQTNASHYYDLINYIIFSKKNYFGNWYKSWKKNYKYLLNKYPKKYINTYVLWKISTEMSNQKLNSRLKIKMVNILKDYINFLGRKIK
jgi:hypothetical protein